MWYKPKLYICELCGRKEEEREVSYCGDKMPPIGWKGNFHKWGKCICYQCAENIANYHKDRQIKKVDK